MVCYHRPSECTVGSYRSARQFRPVEPALRFRSPRSDSRRQLKPSGRIVDLMDLLKVVTIPSVEDFRRASFACRMRVPVPSRYRSVSTPLQESDCKFRFAKWKNWMIISQPYEPGRSESRPIPRQVYCSLLSVVECVSLSGGSSAAEGDLHTV